MKATFHIVQGNFSQWASLKNLTKAPFVEAFHCSYSHDKITDNTTIVFSGALSADKRVVCKTSKTTRFSVGENSVDGTWT